MSPSLPLAAGTVAAEIESSETECQPQAEVRFWPLVVSLRKQAIKRGLWEVDCWSLQGCASDRTGDQRQEVSVTEQPVADGCIDYRWSGLSLELFRDERAAYRFNLSASDPRLFVICSEEDALMQPYLVTASQDDASSYMDGGEEDVYSIAMPEAIQCWIEGFIGRHGEPELEAGKSKRRHHGKRKSSDKNRLDNSLKKTGGERV